MAFAPGAAGASGRTMPLTIEEAIRRIPAWRDAAVGAMAPLPGGITNHNYRVEVGGEAFVVRIGVGRAELLGIDRRREYACTLAASRTGVAPEVVHALPDEGVLVTRYIAGRPLPEPEMKRPETLRRLVHSVHRYHDGPAFPGAFSPFATLEAYLDVARAYGAPLPEDVGPMFGRLREIAAGLRPAPAILRPCHNDLWAPNLIDDGTLIRIVDWEYAGMGDALFDLANFSIHHTLTDAEDEALLQAYAGVVAEPALARMKLLKLAAELREGMWCMVGMFVSEIAFDFAGYAATHFDRYRHTREDGRLPEWIRVAARGA